MKLLTVVYDVAIDESVMDVLDELDVKTWTKFFQAHGEGHAGKKVGTPVWPGANNQLLIAGDDRQVRDIASTLRVMQSDFKLRPGIFMFLQDIEEV